MRPSIPAFVPLCHSVFPVTSSRSNFLSSQLPHSRFVVPNTSSTTRRASYRANTHTVTMSVVRVKVGDVVVAETTADKIVRVEGNPYFPPDSIKAEFFKPSSHTTVCGWKGTAHYKHVTDGKGEEKQNAVWYYPTPKDGAKNIEGYYAFYSNKVTVEE